MDEPKRRKRPKRVLCLWYAKQQQYVPVWHEHAMGSAEYETAKLRWWNWRWEYVETSESHD